MRKDSKKQSALGPLQLINQLFYFHNCLLGFIDHFF